MSKLRRFLHVEIDSTVKQQKLSCPPTILRPNSFFCEKKKKLKKIMDFIPNILC